MINARINTKTKLNDSYKANRLLSWLDEAWKNADRMYRGKDNDYSYYWKAVDKRYKRKGE
jgi:hypothetical protein